MITGLSRITLPSPKATRNIITAMPRATPSKQGRPRSTPTCAPVAVRSTLLGPGVPAAATEKRRKARACSRVISADRRTSVRLPHGVQARATRPPRVLTFVRRRTGCARPPPGRASSCFAPGSADAPSPRHRHDTYAIGVTEAGVQTFDYRGRAERSAPGQVVVLHPDEVHDGRAGTEAGFGYRIVYVEPARIAAAVRAVRGRPAPLPFVREPVSAARRSRGR